ncbi:unnamed protein product [Caenorhabditis auriculariae]|uniref:Uncharacterized protein n=1 Tax=Caenorhabditis auriculariae TaxID=2777116 RepID=A0A8S1HVF6_9PELO|nr:unnamed protein product [Caenorhabditis auriculariae]
MMISGLAGKTYPFLCVTVGVPTTNISHIPWLGRGGSRICVHVDRRQAHNLLRYGIGGATEIIVRSFQCRTFLTSSFVRKPRNVGRKSASLKFFSNRSFALQSNQLSQHLMQTRTLLLFPIKLRLQVPVPTAAHGARHHELVAQKCSFR